MVKRVIKIGVAFVLAVVLIVASYVVYVAVQYYRIEDKLELEVRNPNNNGLEIDKEYTVTTYNIGFGAYDQEYSFFMDTGEMLDGTKKVGRYAKGKNYERVLANTNGSLQVVETLNSDIVLLQEVDEKSTRSYKINQREMFENLSDYTSVFASNFHSAYLFYPLNDPHGQVRSGLSILSRYELLSPVRRSFPVDESFFAKFFDLDRCFILTRIPVKENRFLTLINLHMSAYDDGGIRQAQLEMLNEILKEEIDLGNYVIAGGDFNHDIANSIGQYPTEQKTPTWVSILTDDDLIDGIKIAADKTNPSCRAAEIPYEKGVNYLVTIDGFLVSNDVEIVSVDTYNNEFLYSDHNAVTLKFKLK